MDDTLVLYDGDCAVCHGAVRWLLEHEDGHVMKFAPLQGPTAHEVLSGLPPLPPDLDSIVTVQRTPDGPRVHYYTNALLVLTPYLKGPWRLLHLARWIPRPLRDLGYRGFARIRLAIFGTVDNCMLPSPEQAQRFLP